MFVNLVAPVNQLGYGVVGYNVLKALMDAGHQVSYFPIGQPSWEGPAPFVQKAAENSKMYNPESPSVRIWHQNELSMFPGGGPRIGWPIFELDKFTMLEHHHLSSVDRLFVCSQWAKDVLVREGVEVSQIDVVPLGIDPKVFFVDQEAAAHRKYWTKNKTVFINVGKWEKRKGHEELLEAFCKAFKPGDDVELWMLNHNPFIGRENEIWKSRYICSSMGQNIKILPRLNSQAEMRQIFNTVDFGVFPSHAEGWNLEVLELMACGIPSIVTNYSGHTEFCNDTNSLLLQPNGMEKAQDGKWFHGQGEWCTFDVDELAGQMKRAHEMKQSAAPHGGYGRLAAGALQTAQEFTWDNTVSKMVEAL